MLCVGGESHDTQKKKAEYYPKYVKATERKLIEVWIVSVGRHEGYIPSDQWIEAQHLMADIAERHNRPHRRTNALLSGLLYCPLCGKPLRVTPESNRWTNGKPRFKYVCSGFRKKACTFKAVSGVELDEFVVQKIASISQENSEYYHDIFEAKLSEYVRSDAEDLEYTMLKKTIEKLNADIAAQVRNLREADAAVRKFIQDDISALTQELSKQESALQRMNDERSNGVELAQDISEVRQKLFSFAEFAKTAKPEVLVTLLQTVVERIYITYDNGIPQCHIYLKGCLKEDYTPLFGTAEYIGIIMVLPMFKTMCDSDRGRKCDPFSSRTSTQRRMRCNYAQTRI